MNDSNSSNAQQPDPHSNRSSQASSSDDHELRQRMTRAKDDMNASDTSHATSSSISQKDNPDENGSKTLGSYHLKTAIRMLTDYIADLKTSNVSIDDSVKSRIEEYDALLRELEEKHQQEPGDDKTVLATTQDRGKLISILLDYQKVLLSRALGEEAPQKEDHGASFAQVEECNLRRAL